MWSRGMSSCGAKGTVRVKDERWAEAVGLEHRALAGGGGGREAAEPGPHKARWTVVRGVVFVLRINRSQRILRRGNGL